MKLIEEKCLIYNGLMKHKNIEKQATEIKTKRLKKKSSKQEGLFKQIQKTLKHLEANPRHPGLETHSFSTLDHPWDNSEKVFEAYIQNNTPSAYRIFWCYGPNRNQITIIAIIAHQ
jgi:hypothetical protein